MATSIKTLSVLVVDPDARCRDFTCDTLRGFGVGDVVGCEDSGEALDRVSKGTVDVIFIDVAAAPIDGLALTKQIRSFDHQNRVIPPVILMTGDWSQQNISEAQAAGANEYISKPFSVIDLMGHLMSMIERPQPFIRTQTYFGPDRRNRVDTPFDGKDRRESDKTENTEAFVPTRRTSKAS